MVTVVLDSQAGSCGKGKFIGYLAQKDNVDIAINNFMTNAGHTYVDGDKKVMTQHLPTSIVNRKTSLVIGPGAAITPEVLFSEIIKYADIIGDRSIAISPNAVVIKPEHREIESRLLRSGSTFKGCGASQADKVMRQAELFGSWWKRFKNGEVTIFVRSDTMGSEDIARLIESKISVIDTMLYVNGAIDYDKSILVEGSQGCDLDINYGLGYPNTTSRQCHAGQLVADCGISPRLVDEIIMIMRPYPIRISNETNLVDDNGNTIVTSSGSYGDSKEITWDEIKKRCGAPDDVDFGEKTTVTKKTRRVFEMNWDRLRYVTKLNRPTMIALNFAQYIDWNALYCTQYFCLPLKVREFISKIEDETGVPVKLIGTGPSNEHIIDLR